MTEVQPYFAAFAKAHEKTPQEMKESSNSTLEFVLWMNRQWKEFGREKGITEDQYQLYQDEFREWLLNKTDEEKTAA